MRESVGNSRDASILRCGAGERLLVYVFTVYPGSFFSQIGNNCCIEIDLDTGAQNVFAGVCSSMAPTPSGDGGLATAAAIARPHGLVVNPAGTRVYISEYETASIRVVNTETGNIDTFYHAARVGSHINHIRYVSPSSGNDYVLAAYDSPGEVDIRFCVYCV